MHPAFVGFIPRRPRDLLPVAPLNESVPPVPQRSMNVLMIVHPSLEPVAKNVKEFNPAFFGYIPFPAPTPVKWQALAESNEFMPHGVPAVKPKPRHPKAHKTMIDPSSPGVIKTLAGSRAGITLENTEGKLARACHTVTAWECLSGNMPVTLLSVAGRKRMMLDVDLKDMVRHARGIVKK